MSWISNLFGKMRQNRARDETGGGTESRKLLQRRSPLLFWQSDYTLQNSEIVFAAASRLANTLSTLPVQLYQGYEPVKSELSSLITTAPNPNMTSCNFFKTMETLRCTTGNAYALKILREDYTLDRLLILDPARVTPYLDQDTGDLWYRVSQTSRETRETWWHNWHMIHVQFVSANGYTGVNPVSVLLKTLHYNDQIQHFSTEMLDKGINATVCLEVPATLGKEPKKKMMETFMEAYKETGGQVLMLESGVTAKTLNLSPVDSKLFEVEKITRSRAALVYNLPPHLLGDYSASAFNNVEQQNLDYMGMTMLPIITMYEQELNRKLLTEQQRQAGLGFKFQLNNLLRVDAKTRAEVNFKSVRTGSKLINEVRREEGLPPVPWGDKALVSKDLDALEYILARAAQQLKEGGTEHDNPHLDVGHEPARE